MLGFLSGCYSCSEPFNRKFRFRITREDKSVAAKLRCSVIYELALQVWVYVKPSKLMRHTRRWMFIALPLLILSRFTSVKRMNKFVFMTTITWNAEHCLTPPWRLSVCPHVMLWSLVIFTILSLICWLKLRTCATSSLSVHLLSCILAPNVTMSPPPECPFLVKMLSATAQKSNCTAGEVYLYLTANRYWAFERWNL